MSCDLTSGRLRGECLVGRAGIKTLYFANFNDFAALTGITEAGGEITSLGADAINLFQFDVGTNVGSFEEIPTVEPANGSSFITQNIVLTLFNIKPADLDSLNKLKKGRWAMWALDFQDKIRMFGRTRGCVATGGSDVSGAAPGDKKGLDLTLSATENDFAPFMQDYSTDPFDNYANVFVSTEGYGPELHTDANAASDPNGNEADATTGWNPTGLTGTGANVFESQSAVKNVGGFALHSDLNDTPTPGAKFSKTFTGLTNGATYHFTFDWRHIGTGGQWRFYPNYSAQGVITNVETTFAGVAVDVVASSTTMIVTFDENNVTNDGGIYVDNFSMKQKL